MFKAPRYQWILPAIAFYLYVAGSAPFLGQWDSFDYLKQIVSHQLSALGIGRPVFLGYNILLWESLKTIFRLEPLDAEIVVMAGIILLGVLGVVLFRKLAGRILAAPADGMAALALAVSPVYAVYSGFIMTEVPMLALLIASALMLWNRIDKHSIWIDATGGILFGLAVGMREQALALGAAFLWIIFSRAGSRRERIRSALLFVTAAAVVIVVPAGIFYLYNPAGFLERTRTWLHAIPMGSRQFRTNLEASLLFVFIVCPGAWLALAGAGGYRLLKRKKPPATKAVPPAPAIPNPIWGTVCCLLLPVAVLWRDADVQMHPRYLLVALPASVILCVSLYRNWVPSRRGTVIWAIIQVSIFGLAMIAFSPYRQIQTKKMEFARMIRESVPGPGLMIAGNYSPILDYYRGIGLRPEWQIQWSGWDWNHGTVEAKIADAWANSVPVYLSTDPAGWSYFEKEFLDVYLMLKDCTKEPILPHLLRIHPPH